MIFDGLLRAFPVAAASTALVLLLNEWEDYRLKMQREFSSQRARSRSTPMGMLTYYNPHDILPNLRGGEIRSDQKFTKFTKLP